MSVNSYSTYELGKPKKFHVWERSVTFSSVKNKIFNRLKIVTSN